MLLQMEVHAAYLYAAQFVCSRDAYNRLSVSREKQMEHDKNRERDDLNTRVVYAVVVALCNAVDSPQKWSITGKF